MAAGPATAHLGRRSLQIDTEMIDHAKELRRRRG